MKAEQYFIIQAHYYFKMLNYHIMRHEIDFLSKIHRFLVKAFHRLHENPLSIYSHHGIFKSGIV